MRHPAVIAFACVFCLSMAFAIAQQQAAKQPVQQHLAAQVQPGGDFRQFGGRPTRMPQRSEFPTWENESGFEEDVFTFVRIQYDSFGPFGWWDRWDNDFPDGDWNFSYRLQQMTSLKVAPDSKVLRLTNPDLFNYPFIYMAGVQNISMSPRSRRH